jgi:putative phosphoserine phosphatase / 1-acylglycerol-3-phosphate O-acyltransferase
MASGGAAFFDLDRTLLRGASGPIITETLIAAGIVRDRKVPGMGLFYKFYDVVGETLPGMFLARRAADFASGWVRDAVKEAAETAADVLVDSVAPFAAPLMDEHRRAGRPVVLATTTPYDLVKPLAERLHFDDVIATRYAEAEGKYTGKLDGGFVWGTGKLAAVRRWAEDQGVDLSESWAYSDSIFDFPLLSAVGHPHAVNPDPRLRVAALLRRWPVRHLDLPAGVPKLAGMEPARLLRPFLRPELFPYARFDISGIERIPVDGPAIIVANHRSYFDTAAVALTVARSGRPVRFLGKAEVFDAPVVGQLARAMGGIRVDRGSGSGEPLQAAAEALQAGELVALMPQGTIPRGREFFEPVLRGRHGAARLAAMSRAPVIPIGMWGTEKVWPRNARVPNMLNLTSPPSIRTRVGPPVALSYEDIHADTASIMAAIVDLLPDEARRHHEPTDEELAASMPPGSA